MEAAMIHFRVDDEPTLNALPVAGYLRKLEVIIGGVTTTRYPEELPCPHHGAGCAHRARCERRDCSAGCCLGRVRWWDDAPYNIIQTTRYIPDRWTQDYLSHLTHLRQ